MSKHIPGKFVWFELETSDPKKSQAFLGEVLGWRTVAFPMGPATYEMIYAGDTMIGGYAAPKDGSRSRFVSFVSVPDVDAATDVAVANGARVAQPPANVPQAGRMARIVDPQGAELVLFTKATDDPADAIAPHGCFVWNELHTPDPKAALAFLAKVVGFEHKTLEMGPVGGAYHILSRGGVDRGGVTHHLPAGVSAHWLPYVAVDDTDATVERARRHGGKVVMGPEDIPGAGRAAVIEEPTGALLALLKPSPRSA